MGHRFKCESENNNAFRRKYRRKSSRFGVRQRFFGYDTKSIVHTRKNNNKLDLIKIQNFRTSKYIIKKMKRQATD